jgi:hypothetical protein
VALAEGALALPLVEAGFLVGAMMKDENVREMRQRNKVKKEEKHAKNMKYILVHYNLYGKPRKASYM